MATSLILYDYDSDLAKPNPDEIAARFTFPRQPAGERLCLADYFAPVESGQMDMVALQVVTVGQEATERFDRLQAAGDYSEAYYLHGLAVQTAEATAEYLHRHIRRELGLPEGQGKRYSWGYPAIPDLDDHRLVFDLLPAESELGMSLTAACQLVPEQSTAAIILHHPQAKYYTAGREPGGAVDEERIKSGAAGNPTAPLTRLGIFDWLAGAPGFFDHEGFDRLPHRAAVVHGAEHYQAAGKCGNQVEPGKAPCICQKQQSGSHRQPQDTGGQAYARVAGFSPLIAASNRALIACGEPTPVRRATSCPDLKPIKVGMP